MHHWANFGAIRRAIAEMIIHRFFQTAGHPPPWIHLRQTENTHKEYLVVSNVLQNMVVIDAVLSTLSS